MPSDSDAPGNEPNLELPSFGFGRKKKRGKKSGEAGPRAEEERAAGEAATSATVADQPDADQPAAEPAGDAPAPPRPAVPRAPAAPPAPARASGAAPPPARPAARPPARPPARPASTATPPAATPQPAPPKPAPSEPAPARSPSLPATPPPTPVYEPPPATVESDPEPTVVDPLGEAAAALDAPRPSRSARKRSRAEFRARRRAEKASRERPAPADALVARLPAIKPLYAAVITGALSGLAAVALAIGASRSCEAVRDTSSCGGSIGLLATVAILALAVLIGANLLKAWQISDPFSTSFLGVGLVAIIAMLTFLSHIDSIWMLLVIPLMTAVAFALSWWVTVRIDEHDGEHSPEDSAGSADVELDQDEDSNA